MEVGNANNALTAALYTFDKAEDVKSQEILGALGMTPETQKAQQKIDETMKEQVAQSMGSGVNVDLKA